MKNKQLNIFSFLLIVGLLFAALPMGSVEAQTPIGYELVTREAGTAAVSTEQYRSSDRSVKFTTGAIEDNADVGMIRYTFAPNDFQLDELTSLSYWEYVDSRENDLDIFLDIWLDFNDDGIADANDYDGYLQAEPYYVLGAAPLDTWTYIDAMSLKWSTYVGPDDPYNAPTIAQLQANTAPAIWTNGVDFGQLDILRIDIRVGYGYPTWNNFTGYVDDITINSYVETFPPIEVWVCTTGSCGHPGVEFSAIQAGIDAVAEGGTVHVAAGTYNETGPLTINKANLTIKSISGAASTIININGSGLYNGVEVLKDLGDVTFEGFTVQNFTQDGIKQSYTQKQGTAFHVLNNIVIPQDDYLRNGIEVTGDGSTVIGNTIYGKLLTTDWASCGIQVDDASDVIVENNIIDGDPLVDYGICVAAWDYDIGDVLIQGNTISNAETAIGLMTGIYTPQTISNVSILSNHLSDSNLGIGAFTSEYNSSLLTLTLGGTIKLEDNQFDGIVENDFVVGENVVGASGLVIDASPNWWGQITGPKIADILAEGTSIPESSIAFTPWCGDPGCTFTVPDGNGQIVLDGEYDVSGGFEINVPGLTIILNDGTVIENESPCFIVNADYTTIKAASIGGAQCIPTGDDNGIDVAAGLENIIIEGLEFVGTDGTDGIHFAGGITDVVIVDNWFHYFAGDGIEFTAQPGGTVDIQGNLFQINDGLGINNSAGTVDIKAEYNAWGDYDGPTGTNGDGISSFVDATPWTHVDVYLESENLDIDNWLNQVFVGETITYNVKANLKNVMGAVFVLEYPSNLTVNTTALGDQFESELLDVGVPGKLSFTGYQTEGAPAISGEGLTLFTVTFNAVTHGRNLDLDLDETTDLFSMAPAAGPSNNIYATALEDITSLDVITRPTLNIVGLNGPFVAGISHIITNETCSDVNGGDWTESVAAPIEPDTIGWIRISDITIAEIASLEFLWEGDWYDFSVQDLNVPGSHAVQQDGLDVIARFGNADYGMEIPVEWCDYDAFRVTFLNPGVHDVTVNLYDMMDTPVDFIDPLDILLASFGPKTITIAGDFAVTGTVSMQGRTNRAGVPMTLTKQGSPVYGPFNKTSINVISNNISFTGVNGGIYEVTTAQPRYLNVTADLDKQFLVNAAYLIDALELKGGNAVWSNNEIDLADASLVGGNYGSILDTDADVNFSGKVDIFDLALVGGNFDLTSADVYEDWLVPEFNGTVAGIISETGGLITGEVSGDYNLEITGTPTGGDGLTYVTFTGTVIGDINGTITGTLKFMGVDPLYAIITGTGAGETVRLYGNFLQSGVDDHFEGTIVTGPVLAPITSMSISGGDTVVAGQTLQMTAITDPAGRDVFWSVYVNNRPYGTIDMETGLLTGLQPGTVTVIAVAVDDSNLSYATKVITVTAP